MKRCNSTQSVHIRSSGKTSSILLRSVSVPRDPKPHDYSFHFPPSRSLYFALQCHSFDSSTDLKVLILSLGLPKGFIIHDAVRVAFAHQYLLLPRLTEHEWCLDPEENTYDIFRLRGVRRRKIHITFSGSDSHLPVLPLLNVRLLHSLPRLRILTNVLQPSSFDSGYSPR